MSHGGWKDWSSRRRFLEQDLAKLSWPAGSDQSCPAIRLSDAEAWGAQYVVEGSRLGGAVLARQIHPDWPSEYLEKAPDERPWQDFCAALDNEWAMREDTWLTAVESGSARSFALYREAAHRIAGCIHD